MKCAFINPPWFVENEGKPLRRGIRAGSRWPHTVEAHFKPDGWKEGSYAPFPFFMGYAASYLDKHVPEAEVVVRDSVARGESYEKFWEWLAEHHPAFIFIESATPSWEHDKTIVEMIKERMPYAKVVVCGPIAQTDPAKILELGVFAVIRGEYEKGSVKVVRGKSGLIEHDIMTAQEMNDSPIPMMDDECWDRYRDNNPKGQIFPHLQIWGSRGCWAVCSFCQWPAIMTNNDPLGLGGRKVRFYSPEYLERYLREMLRRHAFRSVWYDDDTGNLSDRHILNVCWVMQRIGIPWSMMCRADTIKRETWVAMKDAGCFGVKIGLESGSQRVLDQIINKRLNLKEAIETCQFIRSIGMTVHITLTVGLPGETLEERRMTTDLVQKLYQIGAADTHQLSATAELDGTPLANMKQGEALANYPGAIKDSNYKRSLDGALESEIIGQ